MYCKYFGLEKKPFELLPNPEFLYPSLTHKKALNYLEYGIHEGAGFILFTGEVGAGKTTIIKDVIGHFSDKFVLALVFNTRVEPNELLALINEDFGLETNGKNKVELLKDLNKFLLEQCAMGQQPILIIDEAQNLTSDALEEVRLLSNLEGSTTRLLQTILVGQPELRDKIASSQMLQLRQRVAIHFHLRSLVFEETKDYIQFRLQRAGNRDAVTFEEGALEEIFAFSQGVPRLINLCCDFLLLAAYADKTTTIRRELVTEVVEDIGLEKPPEAKEDNASEPINGSDVDSDVVGQLSAQLQKIETSLELHAKCLRQLYSHYDERLRKLEELLVERLPAKRAPKERQDG
jgi:putative secretion ATPase (PEP-CTERM system associated)